MGENKDIENTEIVQFDQVKPSSHRNDALQLMTPKAMEKQIQVETEKRAILTMFIKHHMKEGIDFGVITIKSKKTGREYVSKPTLFKAGSEKFCSLFRLRDEYEKDTDTWEMLGSQSGMVCYICKLYTQGRGDLVGEGRGVCTVGEKDGSANNAVKIAKKRAKIDAVLSTGGLSDFFTQDLEDDEGTATPQTQQPKQPKSEKSKIMFLLRALNAKRKTKDEVAQSVEKLTSLELKPANYSEIIGRLEVLFKEKQEQVDTIEA